MSGGRPGRYDQTSSLAVALALTNQSLCSGRLYDFSFGKGPSCGGIVFYDSLSVHFWSAWNANLIGGGNYVMWFWMLCGDLVFGIKNQWCDTISALDLFHLRLWCILVCLFFQSSNVQLCILWTTCWFLKLNLSSKLETSLQHTKTQFKTWVCLPVILLPKY